MTFTVPEMSDTRLPLEIITLDITNFKRIKAVRIEIEPNTRVVTITGRNGQGKSSVLDAIAALIDASKNKIERPVRTGTKEAQIVGVFGTNGEPEIVVERRITADGKLTLVVKDADGVKKQSPASLIKSLFGHLSINPVEFASYEPKKQIEVLLDLVGFDNKAWAERRQEIFSKRTIVNGRVSDAKAKLAGRPAPDDSIPTEPQSVTEMMRELSKLNDDKKLCEDAQAAKVGWDAEVARLEAALNTARESASQAAAYVASLQWPSEVRISQLTSELEDIDETNAKINAANEYRKISVDLKEQSEAAATLTEMLRLHDEKRNKALESSDLPVKGITMTDDGVFLDGVPFEQGSSAEIMRVSTALAIAARPRAGVIMLQNASLMDEDSLAIIRDMATRHNMQVWEEVVNSSEDDAIVIEDGEIAQ